MKRSVTAGSPLFSSRQTVSVTMNQPWVAFDAYLHGSGRVGIMAQAQLDDTRSCDRNLIGTGPFMLTDWVPNQHFRAEKNPDNR